jgi:hypothetical protein
MDNQENPYASPHTDPQLPMGTEGSPLASPGLQRTATGLGLIYYGILLLLLGIVIGMIAGIVVAVNGLKGNIVLFPLVLAGGGAFLGSLMMFIGQIVCLAVPPESGARGLIIGTVVLHAAGFVISFAAGFSSAQAQAQAGPGAASQVNGGAGNLLGFIAAILFILFLRKVSQYIDRPDLASRASNILRLMLVIVALFVMAGILVAAKAAFAPLFMFVGAVAALVMFVMYVNLINSLRKALREP